MPQQQEPPPPKKSRIPEFSSYEEEAKWWDTHDITDYLDELKPVEVPFAKDFTHSICIPFAPKDFLVLADCAETRGTDIITLAKQWILERLKEGRQ